MSAHAESKPYYDNAHARHIRIMLQHRPHSSQINRAMFPQVSRGVVIENVTIYVTNGTRWR